MVKHLMKVKLILRMYEDSVIRRNKANLFPSHVPSQLQKGCLLLGGQGPEEEGTRAYGFLNIMKINITFTGTIEVFFCTQVFALNLNIQLNIVPFIQNCYSMQLLRCISAIHFSVCVFFFILITLNKKYTRSE